MPAAGASTPWQQLLEELAESPAAGDRRLAAAGTAAARTLAKLAEDNASEVRLTVAGNEATPAGVLARLALDGDPVVRARAAQHPRCPGHARAAAVLAGEQPG